MKTKTAKWLAVVLWMIAPGGLLGQDTTTLSLTGNGTLTWTGAVLNSTCRVEWASSVEGPWHSTWDSLTNLVVTNTVMQAEVPMFYRLACVLPPPRVANITPAEALEMLEDRAGDPDFGILDVRTPSEYAAGHIVSALNLDRWSPTFVADLSALPKGRAWLVHCASGSRSAQAVAIMEDLGFRELYNMTGGFSSFQELAGAAAWIEP